MASVTGSSSNRCIFSIFCDSGQCLRLKTLAIETTTLLTPIVATIAIASLIHPKIDLTTADHNVAVANMDDSRYASGGQKVNDTSSLYSKYMQHSLDRLELWKAAEARPAAR